jgi:hypothetical protein
MSPYSKCYGIVTLEACHWDLTTISLLKILILQAFFSTCGTRPLEGLDYHLRAASRPKRYSTFIAQLKSVWTY